MFYMEGGMGQKTMERWQKITPEWKAIAKKDQKDVFPTVLLFISYY